MYLEALPEKSPACAQAFLEHLIEKAPFEMKIVLTDNGKEFTDRFCATGERKLTGSHAFDQACTHAYIEHRLIQPRCPQTNGMGECFNGRIADSLKQNVFDSAAVLEEALCRYSWVYNLHIPEKALAYQTPADKLKQDYLEKPERFRFDPSNHKGPDTCLVS